MFECLCFDYLEVTQEKLSFHLGAVPREENKTKTEMGWKETKGETAKAE